MSLYESLHGAYGWTMAEIDATEMDYIFDLLRVKLLQSPDEKEVFIDEVL